MLEFARHRRAQHSTKWTQYDPELSPLWVADMDFKVCPTIKSAIRDVTLNETFGYTTIWPSAYQAVIDWCEQQYAWSIDQDWIIWLPGIVPAFHLVNELFHDDDKTILIPSPNYSPLLNSAKNLQQKSHTIPQRYCEKSRSWHLDFTALENLLKNGDISIISLANPANPLGYILDEKEISQLNALCAEHDVLICSDEIHCDLIYAQKEHIPMGKITPENSITLMAASKTFNIAGLNTAFAVIPNHKIRSRFKRAASHRIGEPTAIGVTATQTAFAHSNAWRLDLLEYLQGNRDIIHNWGQQQQLQNHYLPDATHLYWLKLPSHYFIDKKIMPSQGEDFGNIEYSRLNFACERELLEQSLEKLNQQ